MINITPNSFSDGGLYLSYEEVLEQVLHLRNEGVDCFDFGAESTAPFNEAISFNSECERLLPVLEKLLANDIFQARETISIDTYKLETFRSCYELIRKFNKNIKVIWNDVSGKLEDEVISYLKANDFKLVISHNLSPNRSETSSHMKFVQDHIDLKTYFEDYKKVLLEHGLEEKVFFDPCFGFSKTLEQNLELLTSIDDWLLRDMPWVLGISRKSFLQSFYSEYEKSERPKKSEHLHCLILSKWLEELSDVSGHIRLHDPLVYKSALLVK